MYRLEKDSCYLHNGCKDIYLVFESESQNVIMQHFEKLRLLPHWGTYQVIRMELLTDERAYRNPSKDNEIQPKDPSNLPLGS